MNSLRLKAFLIVDTSLVCEVLPLVKSYQEAELIVSSQIYLIRLEMAIRSFFVSFEFESHYIHLRNLMDTVNKDPLLLPLNYYLTTALLLNKMRYESHVNSINELLEFLMDIEFSLNQYSVQNFAISEELETQHQLQQGQQADILRQQSLLSSIAASKRLLASHESNICKKIRCIVNLASAELDGARLHEINELCPLPTDIHATSISSSSTIDSINKHGDQEGLEETQFKRVTRRKVHELLHNSSVSSISDGDIANISDIDRQKLCSIGNINNSGSPTIASSSGSDSAAAPARAAFDENVGYHDSSRQRSEPVSVDMSPVSDISVHTNSQSSHEIDIANVTFVATGSGSEGTEKGLQSLSPLTSLEKIVNDPSQESSRSVAASSNSLSLTFTECSQGNSNSSNDKHMQNAPIQTVEYRSSSPSPSHCSSTPQVFAAHQKQRERWLDAVEDELYIVNLSNGDSLDSNSKVLNVDGNIKLTQASLFNITPPFEVEEGGNGDIDAHAEFHDAVSGQCSSLSLNYSPSMASQTFGDASDNIHLQQNTSFATGPSSSSLNWSGSSISRFYMSPDVSVGCITPSDIGRTPVTISAEVTDISDDHNLYARSQQHQKQKQHLYDESAAVNDSSLTTEFRVGKRARISSPKTPMMENVDRSPPLMMPPDISSNKIDSCSTPIPKIEVVSIHLSQEIRQAPAMIYRSKSIP